MATGKVIRELLVALGVKTDEASVKKYDAALASVKKSMLAVGAVAAGATLALYKLAKSAAEAGNEAYKGAQRTGTNTDAYQELAYAAKKSGVEVDQLELALRRLAVQGDKTADFQDGASKGLAEFGISVTDATGKLKTTDVLLMETAALFSGMEDGVRKTAMAQQLFGRSGAMLIPFLNKGSEGIAKLREEAKRMGLVLDAQGIQSARDFMGALKEAKTSVEGLKMAVGMALLPVFAPMLTAMKDWIAANKEVIATKVKEWVTDFGDRVNYVVEGLGGWEEATNKLSTAFKVMLGIWAGSKIVGTLSALWPALSAAGTAIAGIFAGLAGPEIAAIVAGVVLIIGWLVGLYLIIDDLWTLFRGGDSAIGRFIVKFRETEGVVGSLARVVEAFVRIWAQGGKLIQAVVRAVGAELAELWKVAGPLIEKALAKLIPMIEGVVVPVLDALCVALNLLLAILTDSDAVLAAFDAKLAMVATTIKVRIHNAVTAAMADVAALKAGLLDMVASIPGGSLMLGLGQQVSGALAPTGAGAGGGGTRIANTTATINVSGAGDPRAVAREVEERMYEARRTALAAVGGGEW
jgi:hypothetical protein